MEINKILVVDDSKVDLANLQQILEEASYTVITASSGADAIAKTKNEKPDFIFMDIMMEEMDGFQACREITHLESTKDKDIPVVFVTSRGQKADRMWAEMQGGKSLLQKPFTPEQILEEVNKFK